MQWFERRAFPALETAQPVFICVLATNSEIKTGLEQFESYSRKRHRGNRESGQGGEKVNKGCAVSELILGMRAHFC